MKCEIYGWNEKSPVHDRLSNQNRKSAKDGTGYVHYARGATLIHFTGSSDGIGFSSLHDPLCITPASVRFTEYHHIPDLSRVSHVAEYSAVSSLPAFDCALRGPFNKLRSDGSQPPVSL